MPKLVIATRNQGKLREFRDLLPGWNLLSLEDIGFDAEIEEPFDTFRENAAQKAQVVFDYIRKPVLAEDSGLSVAALNGAPGVFSARYAGEPCDDQRNLDKLLEEMSDKSDRSAWYTAVACLCRGKNDLHFFEGFCHGRLSEAPRGTGGFGYDPVFIPQDYDQTFGELPPGVKLRLSHRGQAIRALVDFLQSA